MLWFALTRDATGTDWKIVTTAGAWRQLINYLWPEIRKWASRLKWDKVRERPFSKNELLNLNLRLNHGAAAAAACSNPALIEGAHADSLLFIYDESKAIPAGTFDACEGAFSGTGESLVLALSTPGPPQGRFYDIHTRRGEKDGYRDWHIKHVTLDEAIAANRISPAWAAERALQWGENSSLYQNRVLGEFYAGEEDSVIPLSWVEAAVERWYEWESSGCIDIGNPHTLGVDVARAGEDKTVIAVRWGHVITELRESHHEDTMMTTGRVAGIQESDENTTAIVDVIGVGAGVVDRLREMGNKVQPFNAAAKSNRKDISGELGFVNTRAAAWYNLRDQLDPSQSPILCLPDNENLIGDLVAPKAAEVLSGGKLKIESKDDIKKRIGRSTDHGDACLAAGTHIATENGSLPIEEIRPGMRVWTRAGLEYVTAAGLTRRNAPLISVELTDGRCITGTGNHPVWDGERFRPLDTFVQGDSMWTCRPRESPMAALSSPAARTARAGSTVSIIGPLRRTETVESRRSTSRSTWLKSGQYRPDGTSTTPTAIHSTIALKTSKLFHKVNIVPTTSKSMVGGGDSTASTWREYRSSPGFGTPRRKAWCGIRNTGGPHGSTENANTVWSAPGVVQRYCLSSPTQGKTGGVPGGASWQPLTAPDGMHLRRSVLNAKRLSWPNNEESLTVPIRVQHVRVSGTGDVWNLSVANTPEYFANGILVHNCVQAFWTERGTWADAYGTVTCRRCERGFLLAPNGKTRTHCPFCATSLTEEEEMEMAA